MPVNRGEDLTSDFDRDDLSQMNLNLLSPKVMNSVPRRKTTKVDHNGESLENLDLSKGKSEFRNPISPIPSPIDLDSRLLSGYQSEALSPPTIRDIHELIS